MAGDALEAPLEVRGVIERTRLRFARAKERRACRRQGDDRRA